MAAKQGISAHMAQASDDARRAVLNRVGATWLSNLNTTCTIKSAPPRTPEVMTMLSVRAGWLVKRNEQHVWQRRWCCVVPHTFLYYFEAEPLPYLDHVPKDDDDNNYHHDNHHFHHSNSINGNPNSNNSNTYTNHSTNTDNNSTNANSSTKEKLSSRVENQDALNAAVKNGLSCPSPQQQKLKQTSAPTTDSNTAAANTASTNNVRGPTVDKNNSNSLSPVGIIDLECYTNINRSSLNECVFELSGDEITNPDLRSFFFQAGSLQDCEEWTNALLSDRHSSLKDERDAYKQVCDSCTLQYRNLNDIIQEAEHKQQLAEQEVYKLRSANQTFCAKLQSHVKDLLNGSDAQSLLDLSQRQELLERLDYHTATASSTSTTVVVDDKQDAVQILVDYIHSLHLVCSDMTIEKHNMEQKLSQNVNIDKVAISSIRTKMQEVLNEKIKMEELHQQVLEEKEKLLEEYKNEISSQRMEFTMFQSQAKTKLRDLVSHKKILKKEVIDLRTKLEDVESELSGEKHQKQTLEQELQREKEKSALLEKYIAKMEKQVTVQQNMMEMMSTTGSVVGRIVGPTTQNTSADHISITSDSPQLQQQSQQQPQQQQQHQEQHQEQHHHQQQQQQQPQSQSQPRLPRAPLPPRHHPPPPINTTLEKDFSIVDAPSPLSFRTNTDDFLNTHSSYLENHHTNSDNHSFAGSMNSSASHAERMMKYRKLLNKRKAKQQQSMDAKENTYQQQQHVEDDDDDKSRISELTEDRTQRAFDVNPRLVLEDDLEEDHLVEPYSNNNNNIINNTSNDNTYTPTNPTNPNKPSLNHTNNKLSSNVTATTSTTTSVSNNNNYPPRFIGGLPPKAEQPKLSVAQRARLEANQKSNTTAIRVSANAALNDIYTNHQQKNDSDAKSISSSSSLTDHHPPVVKSKQKQASLSLPSSPVKSQKISRKWSFGDRLVNAIDNSVLGVKVADSDNMTTSSSKTSSLTIAQRQQIQREKQLTFLKQQGLLNDDDRSINSHTDLTMSSVR